MKWNGTSVAFNHQLAVTDAVQPLLLDLLVLMVLLRVWVRDGSKGGQVVVVLGEVSLLGMVLVGSLLCLRVVDMFRDREVLVVGRVVVLVRRDMLGEGASMTCGVEAS